MNAPAQQGPAPTLVVDEVIPIERDGVPFAFHVPTSAFYELDPLTVQVLAAVNARGSVTEADLSNGFATALAVPPEELDEALRDLMSLRLLVPQEDRGRRIGGDEPPDLSKGVANLVMHVAHTCNLGCGYCYAEAGLYKGKATIMTEQRAVEYVDWLFDQADPDKKQLGLTFFGGEPLLNPRVIRAGAAHAQKRAKETGRTISFGITTNGTLVTEEIAQFLQDINATVTVSLDAIGKTNDRLRPFHSGKGSYDLVMDKIRPLLDRKIAVARVTVTRLNLDVVETVSTLLDAGFREVGCSAVDAKNPAYDLDGSHYHQLLEGMKVLTKRYVEHAARGEFYGFSNIHNIVKAIHNGHNKEYPCGAGLQMVAGAPNGKMSLCHRFVGEEDFVLGSLQKGGLDEAKRKATLDAITLKERSDCGTCWARYICSGGCHHVNFLFNGEASKTYLTHCDWLRAWYRTGIETYADLLKVNPTFINQFVDPGYTCTA